MINSLLFKFQFYTFNYYPQGAEDLFHILFIIYPLLVVSFVFFTIYKSNLKNSLFLMTLNLYRMQIFLFRQLKIIQIILRIIIYWAYYDITACAPDFGSQNTGPSTLEEALKRLEHHVYPPTSSPISVSKPRPVNIFDYVVDAHEWCNDSTMCTNLRDGLSSFLHNSKTVPGKIAVVILDGVTKACDQILESRAGHEVAYHKLPTAVTKTALNLDNGLCIFIHNLFSSKNFKSLNREDCPFLGS